MPELVSVIIPCFNAAPFVGETIESVLSQTYREVEIIVVDDGSTDGSPQVLDRYADRIRVISQENRGLPAARNVGLAHARADFVQFLDADDWLLPTKIETCMVAFDPDTDVVVSGVEDAPEFHVGRKDHLRLLRHRRRRPCTWDTDDLPAAMLCRAFNTMEPLYRKAYLLEAGAWDERVEADHDIELAFRLAALGANIRFVRKRVTRVRHHTSGHRLRLQPDFYVGVLGATRLMHERAIRENCLSDLVRERLANRYARWARIAWSKGDHTAAREAISAARTLVRHPEPSTVPIYNLASRVLGFERLFRLTSVLHPLIRPGVPHRPAAPRAADRAPA